MQYKEPEYNPFDAPVPGQSLTDEPGNYPWEHPPKYTDYMEASTFLWNRIHSDKNTKNILALINSGVPIETLVKTTLFGGFMNGLWNPDLAILLVPTVAQMYVAVAKAAGLENITLDLPKRQMKSIVSDLKTITTTSKPTTQRVEKMEEEMTKGLMSRRSEEE
jgi:hypothetical protein|tara:strand:+ start:805 stop:1293 length:489 start_codon:yes stop_codon:yes gene_type:complete